MGGSSSKATVTKTPIQRQQQQRANVAQQQPHGGATAPPAYNPGMNPAASAGQQPAQVPVAQNVQHAPVAHVPSADMQPAPGQNAFVHQPGPAVSTAPQTTVTYQQVQQPTVVYEPAPPPATVIVERPRRYRRDPFLFHDPFFYDDPFYDDYYDPYYCHGPSIGLGIHF